MSALAFAKKALSGLLLVEGHRELPVFDGAVVLLGKSLGVLAVLESPNQGAGRVRLWKLMLGRVGKTRDACEVRRVVDPVSLHDIGPRVRDIHERLFQIAHRRLQTGSPASGVWPRAGHEKTAPDQPTQTAYAGSQA